jgi:hypothetical protein
MNRQNKLKIIDHNVAVVVRGSTSGTSSSASAMLVWFSSA